MAFFLVVRTPSGFRPPARRGRYSSLPVPGAPRDRGGCERCSAREHPELRCSRTGQVPGGSRTRWRPPKGSSPRRAWRPAGWRGGARVSARPWATARRLGAWRWCSAPPTSPSAQVGVRLGRGKLHYAVDHGDGVADLPCAGLASTGAVRRPPRVSDPSPASTSTRASEGRSLEV